MNSNIKIGGKYQFFVSAKHEAIVSVGTDVEIGGTGRLSIGADRFNTVTPALFFGKGLGDLPDLMWALFDRLIPLVEFTMETPLNRGRTPLPGPSILG